MVLHDTTPVTERSNTVLRASAIKHLFRLSVDDFSQQAINCVGASLDLDRTWMAFRPVAATLVDAFHTALDVRDPDAIADQLDQLPRDLRGIGYEGAGMGLAALDLTAPHGSHLRRLILGRGAPHQSLIYLGAGLALARLRRNPMRYLNQHDQSLRWLLLDGYGFHDGFFRWQRSANRPPSLPGYGANAYDQGVGRSLWFLSGTDATHIQRLIDTFAASRQPDLWSGIGLACAYDVGLHTGTAAHGLREAAGPLAGHLAVGIAMGAVFREQGGDAPFTDQACSALWDLDGYSVASLAHEAAQDLVQTPADPPWDRYPRWRAAIHAAWVANSGSPVGVTRDSLDKEPTCL